MKTKTASERKEVPPIVPFRPSDAAKKVLSQWDDTGYDRSVFINSLIVKFGAQASKELPPLLEQVGVNKKRMVRDTGFEPVTPTVSR